MAEDQYIDFVFDGPPGAVSGRFVEIENEQGQSISTGEWIAPKGTPEDGGLWRLRLKVKPGLNALASMINATAAAHGFWDEERNFGEMIALMHSELSEALEEHREGRESHYYKALNGYKHWTPVYQKPASHGDPRWYFAGTTTPVPAGSRLKPEGVAVELADCLIRILDTMQSLDVDIEEIVREKMRYNDGRSHKHGKAY